MGARAWWLGVAGATLGVGLVAAPARSQDLDPRAYVHVPINSTFVAGGLGVSDGAVVSDPTLPITDLEATVVTPSVAAGGSFALFGRTAQAFAALPFSQAWASGKALGEAQSIERTGLSDMRLRISWLVRGAPAATIVQLAKAPRRTILGTSLNVTAPTGQYSRDLLINLGTNRWSFRPGFAVSHPIGQRWLLDTYAGVTFFTDNDESFPGTLVKAQSALGSLQSHISYNFTRLAWAAADLTYYLGGRLTIEGTEFSGNQSNVRVGATVVFPVGLRHSVKFAASKGAVVRFGGDFTTFSFAWQTGWVPRPKPAP